MKNEQRVPSDEQRFMLFKTATFKLESKTPISVIDITAQVGDFCRTGGIQNGLVVVSSEHTTAGVRINEKCDKLEEDLTSFLSRLVETSGPYKHNKDTIDGRPNAHSHLLSYLIGSSETLVVRNGKLQLGKWQRVFFIELDGPRKERQVSVTLIGE